MAYVTVGQEKKDVRLVEVAGGPHNFGWTHADEVNQALLEFLK